MSSPAVVDLVIAAGDGGAEGRARDNRIRDGGGSRGALVARDDGEVHGGRRRRGGLGEDPPT